MQLAAHDGWALSTSAEALPFVLSLCPAGVRVAAWVRGDRGGKSYRPLSSWEPVICFGGRDASLAGSPRRVVQYPRDASLSADDDVYAAAQRDASRDAGTTLRVAVDVEHDASTWSARRVDSLVYVAGARTTDPSRVVGAKPAVFCRWMFDLLGAEPQDDFTDIFPGSGGVARAWQVFSTGALA